MAQLKDTNIQGRGRLNGSEILNVDWYKKYFGKDKPPMTLLFDGSAPSGNVTLTASLFDFDMVVVYIANDDGNYTGVTWTPTWMLKEARDISKARSKAGWTLASNGANVYWLINNSYNGGTTLTVQTENAIMFRIYGINFE